MSLKTKVFKKKITDNELKNFHAQIESILGQKIELVFDLDSFDHDYGNGSVLEDPGVIEGFENNCFKPLLAVLEQMCKEPVMKEHLAENLKKINVKNVSEQDTIYGFALFEKDTFYFRAPATTNVHGPHVKVIQDVIFEAFNQAA